MADRPFRSQLVKLSNSIIRVAERVMGLTGSPLPTEILERIQLVHEMRAIRDWELFDEGIVPFTAFLSQAAVAGQFGFITIGGAPIAAARATDLIIITKIFAHGGVGSFPQLRYNQTSAVAAAGSAFPRDMRISAPPVAMDAIALERGSAVAQTGTLIGEMVENETRDCFFALLPQIVAGAPPTPNLAVWGTVLASVVDVQFEGLYIPTTR